MKDIYLFTVLLFTIDIFTVRCCCTRRNYSMRW